MKVSTAADDEAVAGRALAGVSALSLVPTRLELEDNRFPKLTHYLFRYPAKFHPPVVQSLLDRYTEKGDVVLDPFCGSGTLLVEAAVAGRPSLGLDVDPLSAVVANAKVSRFQPKTLRENSKRLLALCQPNRRTQGDYERLMKSDITPEQYEAEAHTIADFIPTIPNLFHWFRRYVIVDLARIREAIWSLECSENHHRFFEVVFASVIRNASNADPVAVSGLEYTSHMRRRDEAGRLVDPFSLFEAALHKSIKAVSDFTVATRHGETAEAFVGDATDLSSYISGEVDAIITSPPYHGAVDYYRRHQLEHFWLGLTESQDDRQRLLDRYIGRPKVPKSDRFVLEGVLATTLAKDWEARIRQVSAPRADSFKHYLVAMQKTFEGLASSLKAGGPALMVVGHSSWNSSQIPTTQLFAEISRDWFDLEGVLWYPVKNRYMSYERHNEANIDTEYVLVFRRKN